MKALFVTGTNQYGVVSHFMQGMREDFLLLGVLIDELNVGSQDAFDSTSGAIDKFSNYDFIVSFNAVGIDTVLQGETLTDYAKHSDLFIFLVDHPLHLLKRFIGLKVKVLCVDQEHVSFCQLCQLEAIYFPHGISEQQIKSHKSIDYSDKQNEIIFPASFFNMQDAQAKLKPVWHQISTIIEQANSVSRFMQLLGVLPLGDMPASVPLDENIQRICIFADFYIRGKHRRQFLQDCAEKQIELTVIGRNSERYKTEFPLHRYEEAIPFEQLLTRMSAARFVGHNSPGFERGLHERVIYPLALGTLVINDTPFVKQQFADAVQNIQTASSFAEEDYQSFAGDAKSLILAKHTWKSRWQETLKIK